MKIVRCIPPTRLQKSMIEKLLIGLLDDGSFLLITERTVTSPDGSIFPEGSVVSNLLYRIDTQTYLGHDTISL